MAKKIANALEIRSIELAKNAKALGTDIHNHLCNLMVDAAKSRNVDIAFRFWQMLLNNNQEGKSHSIVRADAVKNWMEAFGFVRIVKKDEKFAVKLNTTMLDSLDTPKAMADHVKTAKANPWNKYTPAKPPVVFDLIELIKGAVKRAEDRQTKALKGEIALPEGKHDNIPVEFLDALKVLVADK